MDVVPEIDSIKAAFDFNPTASQSEIARILTRAGVNTYPAQVSRWMKDTNNKAWLMARQDAHRAAESAAVDDRLAEAAADLKKTILDEWANSETARAVMIQDALDWLMNPPGHRVYVFKKDKDGNEIGAPMIPADVRIGLDLIRDRGKDSGNMRVAEKIARLRIELESVEPANRPAMGARVKLIKPGWEPRLVIETTEAKKAE